MCIHQLGLYSNIAASVEIENSVTEANIYYYKSYRNGKKAHVVKDCKEYSIGLDIIFA